MTEPSRPLGDNSNLEVESAQDDSKTDSTPGRPTEQLEVESPSDTTAAEDESQYPTGTKLFLIMLSIGLVLIVGAMDSSIVAVVVPALTNEWHTISDVGWYSISFKLCKCSFQFMFGKLYKLFSVKKVFLASVAIFLGGSTICASAPTSLAFIVGRAICGFATAGVTAGCFTLIVRNMPLRKRPMYTGIAGAVEGVAEISAPMLGGLLVEKLSWRWCFWINLPLNAITIITIALFLEDNKPLERTSWKQKLSELDLVGNVVLVPCLTCLFMVLSWAGFKYPWNSPIIIALLCVFAVLLAVFVIDQWIKQDTATLPPKVLKNRSVLSGFAFSLCCNSSLNVIQYYLPTYFQAVREYTPGKSGYLMLPIVIGSMIAFVLQGVGVRALGYYTPFMLAGSILMPIFSGLMTTLTINTDLVTVLAYSGLFGFAGGIGFQSPQVAVQNTLPPGDANMGLAIILFAQSFGPAIFVAAAQTIFTNQLSDALTGLAPGLNSTNIENIGLTDLKDHIGPEKLDQALMGLDRSLVHTWYLAVALTSITIVGSGTMKWKSIKQKRS